MSPIRFIYFDLDDTLLDHRQAERRALADVCAHYGDHFGRFALADVQEAYHAHNVDLWHRYALGDLSKDDLKRLRFERLLQALAVEALDPDALGAFYMDCYARYWTFPDDARTAFFDLAARYPVGVLTNGFAEIQHAKLDRFPDLRDRSRAIVISEEVGYLKPHPALFAHATRAAGVPAETILYVGDSYRSDVRGGRDAGWQVAWYTAQAAGEPEAGVFRFRAWADLTARLLD